MPHLLIPSIPQKNARQVLRQWAVFLGIFSACVLSAALLLKWLSARGEVWQDIGAALVYSGTHVVGETIALVIILALAWITPAAGRIRFAQWERLFSRLAIHRKQAIFAAAVLPVVARLAMLPAIPLPQPYMPDEFGHLLLGDTFALGRITNPTHAMWKYFETLYVFHQPTYSSIYPVAQSMLMAVPMALGLHPWFGVCASVGLMCGALAWMLQGWLPPKWALLGALLVGAQLAISSYWMNSYWGGAPGAFGGALLLGALPRLLRTPRVRDALIAALGAAVLSQSRPFEGALLTLPVAALVLYRLVRKRNFRVLALLAVAAAVIGSGTLYYNWRVTGDALLWPYQLNQRIYGTPQNLRWSAPVRQAARTNAEKDIRENYEWQLGLFQAQSTAKGLAAALPEKAATLWNFYFQPVFTLPLLFLPLSVARPGVRFALFVSAFVLLAGFVMYPFFFPHYASPLYGLFLLLMLEGARRMRVVRRPLFRWWVVAAGTSSLCLALGAALAPDFAVRAVTPRSQIESELKSRGGKHLVLVRYTDAHNYHHPWIYNAADIDRAPVVWARDSPTLNLAPLLHYFKNREVWQIKVGDDDDVPELTAFDPNAH